METRGMDWRDHIVCDPQILAGKPVIRGTRLSVDFLLSLFAAGWTAQQVHENYPQLTPDSLRATFAFAAQTLGEEEFYPLRRRAM